MKYCRFSGGPWNHREAPVMTAVPSQRVSVYADPPEGAVCADEQVTQLLGHYEKTSAGSPWQYAWIPV